MSYLINTLLHPLSIFLGVLLIFIGVVGYYFHNKLKEQNLKIDSIASVVSTMALEMRNIHSSNLNRQNTTDKYINLNTSNVDNEPEVVEKHSLINVSDSDETNSSEDDSHESYESESDGYETDDSNESTDAADEDNFVKPQNNKKILQHTYESGNIDENIIVFKIDNSFNNIEDINIEDINIEDILQNVDGCRIEEIMETQETLYSEDNIVIELKEEPLENLELENVETEQLSQNNTIDLDKDNVEILLKSVEVDYKKLTLNKLKEIALEKGLIDENTKLKKQDLLKLLSN
jgi:hypothetical protein